MNFIETREFGRRYAEAWSGGNPDAVAAFFAETGSLSVNGGIAAIGRAAIAEVARGFMAAFPDLLVTMDELTSRPEGWTFHWTLRGTTDAAEGSGNRVCISGYEEWRIGADELIVESKGHFDANEYARQLEHGFEKS